MFEEAVRLLRLHNVMYTCKTRFVNLFVFFFFFFFSSFFRVIIFSVRIVLTFFFRLCVSSESAKKPKYVIGIC